MKAYDALDKETVKCALATVVNVQESSYRRIGARMLVQSTGTWIGGISGGCLEGDALKRSQLAIYKNEVSVVTYDTMEDDANQIGVGLGCNGRIDVLFIPIDYNDPDNPIEKLRMIIRLDEPQILVQVIESKDKSLLGKSVAGKTLESSSTLAELNKDVLKKRVAESRLLQRPQVIDMKNDQGDQVKLLVEYIRPALRVIILGDNYDVYSMTNLCHELAWKITVVGNPKKLAKSVFDKATAVLSFEQIDKVKVDPFTAVVFMTHDYNWDKKLLPYFLDKDISYLGMLGPKKRLEKMNAEMPTVDLLNIKNLYSPIGLDIGAESPEEIAFSICTEIIAVLRKREGGFLKDRKGPIHERIH